MSRIGRLPVAVPAGVDVAIDGQAVTVKGPKGELSARRGRRRSRVEKGESGLEVTRPDDERVSRSLHGLTRTLINNMVIGVTEGYEKKLEIVGTGYRVRAKGADLEFALGFSHPVIVEPARPASRSPSRAPDPVRRAGHRQAAGRRGRREHPQDPQARARTRARACATRASRSAARSERLVSKPWHSTIKRAKGKAAARSRRHFRLRKKVVRAPRRVPAWS